MNLGKVVKVVGVVLVLVLVLGVFAVFSGYFAPPSVEGVELSWGNVSEDRTEIVADVEVDNPNPIGLSLGNVGLRYEVFANEVLLGSGSDMGVNLEKGSSGNEFVVELNNSRLDEWWVTHLENGEESDIVVNASLVVDLVFTELEIDVPGMSRSFDTDFLRQLDFGSGEEISFEGTTYLVIEDVEASWGEVGDEESVIDCDFVVRNPNEFSVPLSDLGYVVSMNGVELARGNSSSVLVGDESSEVLEGSIVVDNSEIPRWWVTHLEKNEESDVLVRVSALLSAFGEEISFEVGSYESSFVTDIL